MNLRKNNCVLTEESVNEFVELYKVNPTRTALEVGGPLGSFTREDIFLKEQFLNLRNIFWMLLKIEYQYIPVLQTLQEVLNSKHVNLESF